MRTRLQWHWRLATPHTVLQNHTVYDFHCPRGHPASILDTPKHIHGVYLEAFSLEDCVGLVHQLFYILIVQLDCLGLGFRAFRVRQTLGFERVAQFLLRKSMGAFRGWVDG
jgi:hypothetical protein